MPISISFLYPLFLWLLLLIPLFLALGWPSRNTPDRRQRWVGLALRILVLVSLVLGLAGAQLEHPVETVTTVFVLDVSDSVTVDDRAEAEAFLRQALAEKPEDDRAAVILFGGDALVERLPSLSDSLPALSALPVKQATNIEAALRLALALLPNEGGSRLVLLSDGQETAGQARRLADLAAARRVEIDVFPLGASPELEQPPEVLVERVTAPAQARQGQTLPVEVIVTANAPAEATLRLLANGALVESRPVQLNSGQNRYNFSLPATEAGFRRIRVELEAANDRRLQNNWGAAYTTVFGPPSVLLVEETPTEGDPLAAALAASGIETTVIGPESLPQSLPALTVYDAVILANVPAEALPAAGQELLATFVRDLGRGLVMVGGPESYGAGGYLRTPLERALPVDMEIRSRSREPNLALVVAVDKSGSMGACHCDDPDSRRERLTRAASGLPKIDIAKEAVFQAAQVLGELDYMGVVAFDSAARWALETAPHTGLSALEQSIGGLSASGQTNIFAGLTAAQESLVETPARIKHIILLTDGWSSTGAYDHLLDRFSEAGITLSVVAAGGGSAAYLQALAEEGGGKYYPATNMLEVPQIFLKETIRASGNHIIEEPFLPAPAVGTGGGPASPILRGVALSDAPPLLGYNGSTAKATAQVSLYTPRGDPLLATWQYGLGRSAAWTSDFSGRWAQEWLAWEEFPQMAGQLVNWTLPSPGDEQLDLAVSVNSGEVTLRADVRDEAGQHRSFLDVRANILAGDGQTVAVDLLPTGPGQYEATTTLPAEGVYLAQITAYEATDEAAPDEPPAPIAGRTAGLVLSYSAEYANLESDLSLLSDLAAVTGGRILTEPDQAFVRTANFGRQTRPLWPTLLLLAALLFPIDVALRRLRLGRREWQQARRWVVERMPGQTSTPAAEAVRPPIHDELFQARQRARGRYARPTKSEKTPPEPAHTAETSPTKAESPAERPEPSSKTDQDTLARLRAAKKRAKR